MAAIKHVASLKTKPERFQGGSIPPAGSKNQKMKNQRYKSKRINYLKKVREIQNITLEHTMRGASQKWVYDNYIKESYFISLGTFYMYMGINAKRELKELQNENQTG